jgi:hypothetical protein
MKHVLYSTALAVIALSLASCAAPGGAASTGASKQLGPHAAQNFTIVHMKPAQVASDLQLHSMCLVVKAESSMQGGKQVINLSASSHLDGPDGALEAIEKIGFHMTQPMDFSSKPNDKPTAGVTGSQSVPAAGGKYKTVVVDAVMSGEKIPDAKVTLTVPGDQ